MATARHHIEAGLIAGPRLRAVAMTNAASGRKRNEMAALMLGRHLSNARQRLARHTRAWVDAAVGSREAAQEAA